MLLSTNYLFKPFFGRPLVFCGQQKKNGWETLPLGNLPWKAAFNEEKGMGERERENRTDGGAGRGHTHIGPRSLSVAGTPTASENMAQSCDKQGN